MFDDELTSASHLDGVDVCYRLVAAGFVPIDGTVTATLLRFPRGMTAAVAWRRFDRLMQRRCRSPPEVSPDRASPEPSAIEPLH